MMLRMVAHRSMTCAARRCLSSTAPNKGGKLRRDVSALDRVLEATTVQSKLTGAATDTVGSSSNLMYQGEWVENWEELLAEARASYPPREGPRRSRQKRRLMAKWKVVRRQHNQQKLERIEAHHRELLDRNKRALERKGWFGPVLAS